MADESTKIQMKKEFVTPNLTRNPNLKPKSPISTDFIQLSSTESDSDSSSDNSSAGANYEKKKRKKPTAVLPVGFLDPLPEKLPPATVPAPEKEKAFVEASTKQFWKAGDYEGTSGGDWEYSRGGMDHVRVHPRFLHSNATSHKWVLGAFAELLDNSLDEVCNGATYVNLDMVMSKKDGSKMLLIEDNGGGMDPEKMRHCMSLGYSAKSRMTDAIGQYGNGFKTSTMRLGADVIVFSRSHAKDGKRPTQSIGLLSYTFLRSTGKEDIVVPMLDYERRLHDWKKIVRSSTSNWNTNVETITQWSPFSSEAELLQQFNQMKDHGTRIIIYNLWQDDEGQLELDFDTDPHDIQIRGVNRDEKSIEMAQKHPNSRHFLTYRHSFRSYAAILYLRIPPGFRIILRGKDVDHHNIVNDMMMSQENTYRPQPKDDDDIQKDSSMVAVVTVGFVKDARAHIDVQGFNVYHKNRLIKPFWRVWHPPGSDGRGVIGVLEANFVEPAHDKQSFERTIVLARLESKLIQMQKKYWSSNCDKIGYAPRHNKRTYERDTSPDSLPNKKRSIASRETKFSANGKCNNTRIRTTREQADQSSSSVEEVSENDLQNKTPKNRKNGSDSRDLFGTKDGIQTPSTMMRRSENAKNNPIRETGNLNSQDDGNVFSRSESSFQALAQLKEENRLLRERLARKEEEILGDLLQDLKKERERCTKLENQVKEVNQKYDELSNDQERLVDIFSEERKRRDAEEENLRKKLKEASNTIEELLDKLHRSSQGR